LYDKRKLLSDTVFGQLIGISKMNHFIYHANWFRAYNDKTFHRRPLECLLLRVLKDEN
jgi:hypothetical protein